MLNKGLETALDGFAGAEDLSEYGWKNFVKDFGFGALVGATSPYKIEGVLGEGLKAGYAEFNKNVWGILTGKEDKLKGIDITKSIGQNTLNATIGEHTSTIIKYTKKLFKRR